MPFSSSVCSKCVEEFCSWKPIEEVGKGAEHEANKAAVIADLATKLDVTAAKVRVKDAREGSTIVDFEVNVPNATTASEYVAVMKTEAASGTLSFGGVLTTAMSEPVSLSSNGPRMVEATPNVFPIGGNTTIEVIMVSLAM